MNNLLKFACLLSLLLTALPSHAWDFKTDDIYYNIMSESDRTVEVTYPNSYGPDYRGSVDIPIRVIHDSKTYRVIGIGRRAFQNAKLTSITIPTSITSIGDRAFDDCSLTTITIPNSVTIMGDEVFRNCHSLKSIELPNSLMSIGDQAFWCCWDLVSITIPESVTSIGYAAFKSCNHIESITIPESVTSLGNQAFSNCSILTTVINNGTMSTIPEEAFSWCQKLNSITIPSSVTSIEGSAFYRTDLETIDLPDGLTSIGTNAFRETKINEVTLPASLTSMGRPFPTDCHITVNDDNQTYSTIDGVLYNKDVTTLIYSPTTIESIDIPESVVEISKAAFDNCTKLSSIKLPESVETIGDGAFYNCTNLSTVIIPNAVASIGTSAFSGCNSLTSIYCQPIIPPTCDPNTFSNEVLKNCMLYVPNSTKSEYEAVDPWRNFWNIEEMDFGGIGDMADDDSMLQISVVDGVLTIDGIGSNEAVAIYDMQGRTVHNSTEHTITNLAPGIYIARCGSKKVKFTI